MGSLHKYDFFGKTFAFLLQVRVYLIVNDGENASKKEMDFFFVATTPFFDKAICAITDKQHNCRFLIFKLIVQNMAVLSAFKTFVTVFIIIFP